MNIQSLKRFLKEPLIAGLIFSVTVFAWLRMIFFEVPFSLSEDGVIFLKTILCGSIMMTSLKVIWLIILHIGYRIEAARTKKIQLSREIVKVTKEESIVLNNVA
jgi:hypothetical protein